MAKPWSPSHTNVVNADHPHKPELRKWHETPLRVLCALAGIATLQANAYAQTMPPRPVMHSEEMRSEPMLDGRVMGDLAWEGLVPATGFWQVQPDDGQPETQKTEVLV